MSARRYRIVHKTEISYSIPVSSSHNELRMTPVTEAGQTTLESRLRVRPLTWSHVYRDYWGTHVTCLEALGGHQELEIESMSTVERYDTPPSGGSERAGLSWAEYAAPALRDTHFEWITSTPHTWLPAEITEAMAEASAGLEPAAAVHRVVETIADRVEYQAGVTGVGTTAQDAWTARQGVCQDFTHMTLGALRSLGIPCRYVSGYQVPQADLAMGETASGQSHAWVEWWDGAWRAIDPTSRNAVGLDHVLVGRGRDYADVSPFTGVFQGAAQSSLTVEVTFTRT